MKNINEILNSEFSFLFDEYNFEFIKNPKGLEDLVAIIKRRNILFRFILDRNDFFLDLGLLSKKDIWINFYCVLEWLKSNGQITDNFKPINKANNIKKLLRQNIKIILSFIQHENFENLENFCRNKN